MSDPNTPVTLKDAITIGVSGLSLVISLTSLLFSRKDHPSLSPEGTSFTEFVNLKKLSFIFKNYSPRTIYDLRVVVQTFDKNRFELPDRLVKDIFAFPIPQTAMIHYTLENPVEDMCYVRFSFEGYYRVGIPLFRLKYRQILWYRLSPILNGATGQLVGYDHFNTYDAAIRSFEKVEGKRKALSEKKRNRE